MTRGYIPNAWEQLGEVYHVAKNHPKASDENPGTHQLPLKTISAASAKARDFDEILIDEGVYREQVSITRHGIPWEPRSQLLFRAIPGKEVYLLGSDPFNEKWKEVAAGTFRANLPASLFADGIYNPYELSCVVDELGKVRPSDESELPETLGQIYVDGRPLEQLKSVQAVQDTTNSFVVSADGKEIICNFADGKAPAAGTVELTVRQRCFKPTFEVDRDNMLTVPLIQTKGMVIARAAEPGAFSRCRPLTIRKNPESGVLVRKTFDSNFSDPAVATFEGNVSYLSKDSPTMFCARVIRRSIRSNESTVLPQISDNDGRTWHKYEGDNLRPAFYFLDEENGMLFRHWRDAESDDTLGAFADNEYRVQYQVSPDGGQTWSKPEIMPLDKTGFPQHLIKLQNGELLWCIEEDIAPPPDYCGITKVYIGRWRDDRSGVDWKLTARIEGEFNQKQHTIGEPHACQFPDGRIFMTYRMSSVLPTKDECGMASLKSFAMSEDNGRTWTKPEILCYENGSYVYSSDSWPDAFRSSKNGRPYVIMNINDKPTMGCDPRDTLQIAELSTDPVAVKRNTVSIIEQRLPEHHPLVRHTMWLPVEQRNTGNLLLFMKLMMAEYAPVRNGYDFNCHRYEIILPE